MSFLAKIFGADKAIDKGLDVIDKTVGHVASGLDQIWYTDEEKASDYAKLTELKMNMVKDLQDSFTPRAITRRILALIIYGNYFLHANLWVIFKYFGKDGLATSMQELLKMETQLILVVTFFYFGYYGLKTALKK